VNRSNAALLPLLCAAALAAPAGGADDCSEEDAEKTELALGAGIDILKASPGGRGAWEKLSPALRTLRRCDEDELSELFSDAVCRQLADGWKDAAAIASAVRRSPELLEFLLRHLDHGCAAESLEKVRENAKRRCPRYGLKFCTAVAARAAKVLEELPAASRDE
jgi:hypothetical protein